MHFQFAIRLMALYEFALINWSNYVMIYLLEFVLCGVWLFDWWCYQKVEARQDMMSQGLTVRVSGVLHRRPIARTIEMNSAAVYLNRFLCHISLCSCRLPCLWNRCSFAARHCSLVSCAVACLWNRCSLAARHCSLVSCARACLWNKCLLAARHCSLVSCAMAALFIKTVFYSWAEESVSL